MGQARMVAVELFLADEVHRHVVFVEVVRHLDDLLGHLGGIGAFLQNNPALARVLFARGELRVRPGADRLKRLGNRDGVLTRIGNAGDTAKRIGMPLGNATAPERVVDAFGQNAVGVQAVQREQARIPTAGDKSRFAGSLGSGIDGGKMLGDLRMGVEGVYHVVERSVLGRLLGQVGCAAAAQNQNIDVLFAGFKLGNRAHRNAGRCDGHVLGVAARVHGGKLHIVILANGKLNTLAKVSVAQDTNANHAASFLTAPGLSPPGKLIPGGILRG